MDLKSGPLKRAHKSQDFSPLISDTGHVVGLLLRTNEILLLIHLSWLFVPKPKISAVKILKNASGFLVKVQHMQRNLESWKECMECKR